MSEFTSFLFKLANGLTFAGLLFMIASGFTLIFGLMRVVNMAHAVFYILAGYVAWTVQEAGSSWIIAIAAGTIAVAHLGYRHRDRRFVSLVLGRWTQNHSCT